MSAQQLRAAEVRAKIGGVGGYAPQKALVPGEGTAFAVNLHFSGGQSERVAFHVSNPAPAPTIEAEAEPGEGDAVSEPAPPSAKLARLAKAFGAKAEVVPIRRTVWRLG